MLVLAGGVNYTTPETVNIRGGTLASEAGTVDTFAGPIVLNFSSVLGIRADSGSTLHLMGSAITMQGFTLTVGGAGNVIIGDILSGGLRGVDLPFLQAAFSHGLARAIDGPVQVAIAGHGNIGWYSLYDLSDSINRGSKRGAEEESRKIGQKEK